MTDCIHLVFMAVYQAVSTLTSQTGYINRTAPGVLCFLIYSVHVLLTLNHMFGGLFVEAK